MKTTGSVLFSFIGRKPISITPENEVYIKRRNIFPVCDRPHKTKIIADIFVKGALGELSFPIHQGLCVTQMDGKQVAEKSLVFSIDSEFFDGAPKNQKRFIEAMWGTTAVHIRNMINGVNQVFSDICLI